MNFKGIYTCQTCENQINSPKHGYLQWQNNKELQYYDFRIVHHLTYSPLKTKNEDGCYAFKNDEKLNDLPLDWFYGIEGLDFLLKMSMRKTFNGAPKILYRKDFEKLFFRLYNFPFFIGNS